MKTFNKTYLPEVIEYAGATYKVNGAISGAMKENNTSLSTIAITLKKEGRKAVLVRVLSKSLRGKTDLHGKPYQPTKWIYTTN